MGTITNTIIGGIIGVTAGLLMAPQSGEDTRSAILDTSSKLQDMIGSRAGDAVSMAGQMSKERTKMMSDLTKQAKSRADDLQRRGKAIQAILRGEDIPDQKSSVAPFIMGMLLGGMAGAVVALVSAPRSGAEMRATLRDRAQQVSSTVRSQAEQTANMARDRAQQVTGAARSQVGQATQQVRDTANTMQQRGQQAMHDQPQSVKTPAMNKDIAMGKWQQIRGDIRQKWGKLTDNELDQVQGNSDKLAGYLQEKYGYSRDRAEQEARNFMNQYK